MGRGSVSIVASVTSRSESEVHRLVYWRLMSGVAARTVRGFVALLLILAASSCGTGSCESTKTPPESVVIIVIDTWRADRFAVDGRGAKTAPHLAAWSRRGTVFTRAVAASPWTGPSVASIVTGRYPDELGMRDLDDPLPRSATTLGELFQQAGWETAAIVSNGYIAPWFGHDQGYGFFYKEDYRGEDDGPLPVFTASRVTDKALEWIQSVDGRFFLYVHYTDPHDPYLPPAEYRERFAGAGDELDEALLHDQLFARQPLTAGEFRGVEAMYDASVAFADQEIGRLLEQLSEETLVVITGDHGEEFLDHGAFLHGHTVFEELVHVPLLIAGPGVCSGKTNDEIVSHVDIGPTIVDLTGIPGFGDATGRSLSSSLRRGRSSRASPIVFSVREYGKAKLIGARQDSWKVIYDEPNDRAALFDLSSDPGELKNIAATHPKVLAEFIEAIQNRRSRVEEAPPYDDEELQRKRMQELRSLGYVQ